VPAVAWYVLGALALLALGGALVFLWRRREAPPAPDLVREAAEHARAEADRIAAEEREAEAARVQEAERRRLELERWKESMRADEGKLDDFLDGRSNLPVPPAGPAGGKG
jgi:hypothetical protein